MGWALKKVERVRYKKKDMFTGSLKFIKLKVIELKNILGTL